MSPSNQPGVSAQLRQLIYYHLDNNLLKNALFCAGRLHGLESRNADAAHLLALCHLRLGELKAAHYYSKPHGPRGTHLGCAYVFAQACLALEQYSEGISALEKSRPLWWRDNAWNKHSETRRQHLPDAAAVYCLQGKLFQAHDESHRAVDCYSAALGKNPFMWDAFQGLCDLGVNVRLPNIFKMTPEMIEGGFVVTEEVTTLPTIDDSPPLTVAQNPPTNIRQDPFNSQPIPQGSNSMRNGKVPLYEKYNGSHISITPLSNATEQYSHDSFETPTNPGGSQGLPSRETHVLDESAAPEPPQAPARRQRVVPGLGDTLAAPTRSRGASSRPQSAADQSETEGLPALPAWNSTGMADRKRTASGQVSKASIASTRNGTNTATDAGSQAPQRRSVRLFNQVRPGSKYSDIGSIHKSMSTAAKDGGRELKKAKATVAKPTATRQTAGRIVSGNRRTGDPMDVDPKEARAHVPSGAPVQPVKPSLSDRAKEQEAIQLLLDMFSKLGSGYFSLSHFQNEDAYRIFNGMPLNIKDTPWVTAQIGKSLFEQAKYAEAEKQFSRARLFCPSRLEDVEYHAIALWHLKAEVDLAHLAHEATGIDRLSPQTWVVVGNSLSLDRNHDKALLAFTRATQLDPTFAYAYTLQGHEHVANEEYDKALSAYRAGMAADPRHYNAYYGVAKVFEKQGKYEDAERHFRIATSINPTNAILISAIGNILEKMKRPQAALEQFKRSVELQPKSALHRYRLARLLLMMNLWEPALVELRVLKDQAPNEANVQFLLGKAYKALGMKGEAIKHFTAALNLDPKASHHIKEAMEQMEDEYDDDVDAE